MSTSSPLPPQNLGTTSTERVRLHITPFNRELLEKYLAPSVRPLASDISFHTVQTFPERGFGFVELPAMEAQKLKKKLNGSTLKGSKVRVEDARAEKKRKSSEDGSTEDAERKARKLERKERKERRREEGVIEGVELEEGRRVKRGWKEDRASGRGEEKRRKAKSNKTDDAEDDSKGKKLRFKTVLPPTPNSAGMDAKIKKNRETSKEVKGGKKKVVLEEFHNHVKPLASSAAEEDATPGALSYEDGRGWIDEAGNLIQSGPASSRLDTQPSASQPERRISAIESREIADEEPEDTPMQQYIVSPQTPDPETPTSPARLEASSPPVAEASKAVHPLEALFKRPATRSSPAVKPRPKPIDTSFTFFSGGGGEEDEEMADVDMPPQTPHTKRDLEWRSIRSAAPTPDTAAIGRKFSFPANFAPFEGSAEESDDAQDEEMKADHDSGAVEDAGRPGESAWRKSFYENRGDLSRGWRKRRRDEKKGLRQRENRRLSRRVV